MISVSWDTDHWLICIRDAIHPKGSGTPMINRYTKRAIIVPYKTVTRQLSSVRKELKKAWGNQPPIKGPVAVSLKFYYVRPKGNKDPFPYTKGDIDKLERMVLDCLAGNDKEPGPVLADDKYVVKVKDKETLWSESNEALVSIWPIGELA